MKKTINDPKILLLETDLPRTLVFCYQLGDDHSDRSQLERVIEGWVQVVAQGGWRVMRVMEGDIFGD